MNIKKIYVKNIENYIQKFNNIITHELLISDIVFHDYKIQAHYKGNIQISLNFAIYLKKYINSDNEGIEFVFNFGKDNDTFLEFYIIYTVGWWVLEPIRVIEIGDDKWEYEGIIYSTNNLIIFLIISNEELIINALNSENFGNSC